MSSSIFLALGILASSFFGSWHCAGMCGPISTLMSQRKNLIAYHLGRFVAYNALGLLAGSIGQFFLNNEFILLRWISAILFAAILLIMGLRWLLPNINSWLLPLPPLQSLFKTLHKLHRFHTNQSGFMVGLLTALLPCGWLYTYVTAAIATKSIWSGVLVMTLFWLGGLPVLCAVPSMVRKTISSASQRQQRIAGGILIFAGLYSLFSFVFLHSQ